MGGGGKEKEEAQNVFFDASLAFIEQAFTDEITINLLFKDIQDVNHLYLVKRIIIEFILN